MNAKSFEHTQKSKQISENNKKGDKTQEYISIL